MHYATRITMKLNEFEEKIIRIIERVPNIQYKGRAVHIGMWETKEDVWIDLNPPISEIDKARFRFLFFFPENGVELMKIEMYPFHYYDWETVYNGIIPSVEFFEDLLTKGLSILLAETSTQKDSLHVFTTCKENKNSFIEPVLKMTGRVERDIGGQVTLTVSHAASAEEFILLDSSYFPEIKVGSGPTEVDLLFYL